MGEREVSVEEGVGERGEEEEKGQGERGRGNRNGWQSNDKVKPLYNKDNLGLATFCP